jgi:hypothetical protein
MRIIYFVLLLMVVGCRSSTDKPLTIAQKITYDTSTIAIIPFDTSMKYIFDEEKVSLGKLSQQELSDIDKIINESVKRYNSKITGEQMKFLVVDLKKNQYKRQYVIVTNEKREKLVFVNCVCDYYFRSQDWKSHLNHIVDGGACEFRLTINLTTKQYFSFRINGFG